MSDPNLAAGFEAPDPTSLASLFPGYEIEYLIAVGGMGAVYKAVQISLDRPVAIKILPREFGEDVSYRAGFEAEAKAMARLNHPNLIGVYDFGKVDGMLFIIMEFVPGQTLFHSANGIAIAEEAAARIVIDVCLGLAHAHEHGILHRDIKPGNILLDQETKPKIGDFGLARHIDTTIKDGESIFGTPHYTAPEVIKYPNSVGASADIFSVGVVLHELLTGSLPSADPRPPSAICGCDKRFDAIIRRATHPSPHLRYTSAAEMAKEISVVAATIPSAVAKQNPTAPSIHRPAAVPKTPSAASESSNKILILAASSVAAAIILALFIVLHKPAPATTETAPVPPPTADPAATPEPTPVVPQAPEPKTATAELKPERTITHTPDPEPESEAARLERINQTASKLARDQPPTTEPTPEPAPEPTPEPTPLPAPAPIANTNPAPIKVAPASVSNFDVAAFFDRARGIMRQKAAPLIDTQEKEIVKNFESFERKIKGALRKIDKYNKETMELRAEVSLTEWRTNGHRIPKTLNAPTNQYGYADSNPKGLLGYGSSGDYGFRNALYAIHPVYLSKQDLIDQKLELDFIDLSATYILGLEKQIERLTNPEDAAAVKQLQAEIAAVKNKPSYFSALMRGSNLNAGKLPVATASGRGSDTAGGFLDDLKELDAKLGYGSLGKHGDGPDYGTSISVRGIKPNHSLLAHPPPNGSSVVLYSLLGDYSTFTGTVTLPDRREIPTPLTFQIIGDDKVLWKSRAVRNAQDAQEFSVSVKSMNKITLEVRCPGSHSYAWAVWLNPLLSK
jgi:serine/threonine protein kinase